MSNMSYCRFQNTSQDLGDCIAALENHWDLDLSTDEVNALEHLLAEAREIVDMEDTINELIDNHRSKDQVPETNWRGQ